MHILRHTIIIPLHPVPRSDLSILLDTFLSYTRRTRTMVYALRNRRKYCRRHLVSAYGILK